jgi:hypothetical protein
MTRREYAIYLNLAQPGKGRMSNAARDAIAKAEADGMEFADPAPVSIKDRVKARSAAAPQPTTPKAPVQTEVQTSDTLLSKPFTGKFEAIMPNGKRKAVSERTACQCGASLTYCLCKTPTVGLLIVDPGANDVDAVVQIAKV